MAGFYAGGQFTAAGGVPAYYIAVWDGSAWSALGSGMNYYVYTLAFRRRAEPLHRRRIHHRRRQSSQQYRPVGRSQLVGVGVGSE